MPSDSFTIIRTKLHKPSAIAQLVERPRLVEQLNNGLERRFTLVSAGAGYGKSTLVSAWLEQCDCLSAWLSLDEYDNDLADFLSYFIAAVQTIVPEACKETVDLIKAPELPPLRVLAATFINELALIDKRFVIVLDDYQLIRDQTIHAFLSEFLRYPPQTLHLVLITRKDPPLALTTFRAKSLLSEIRTLDLCFTQAEVSDYLNLSLDGPADKDTVTLFTKKSEGWITGLRLLSLSVRRIASEDLAELPNLTNNHLVEDYLMSIILSYQDSDIQDCLLKTAVLNRYCAPLCEAVCGMDGDADSQMKGDEFIRLVNESNLFIVPLDTQRHWFRYHHLFQELLQRQLEKRMEPAEIIAIHRRASQWYAENGFIDEAIRHALSGDDTTTAVDLVAQHRHSLLNEEDWHILKHWLDLFPSQLVEEEPELLVTKAWILYNRSKNTEMVAVLDRAETALALNASKSAPTKYHQAEIDAMRCEYVLVYEVDSERAVSLALRALSEIPHDWFNIRGLIYVILGYGYLMLGKPEQGFEIIYDVLKSDRTGSSAFRVRLLTALCFLHYTNADMLELGQVARQLLKLGETDNLPESAAYARYFLGCYHYLRNELVEAEKHLNVAANDRHIVQIWSTINSACVLALVYQAQDRPEHARDSITETITYLRNIENVEFLPQVQALQAELALRQEHLDEASRWARQFDPYPLPLMVTFYIPQLTLVKVLLAQDTTVSREQAADLLAKLYEHVLNDKRYMIEVLALQSLLDDAQGDQAGALDKLERAVLLAEPGGFIRLFVDLGPKMADLLDQLRQKGFAPHYIDQILDAFGGERQSPSKTTGLNRTTSPSGQPSASGELVEPLTNREFDVLTLMAQGMTNKEIAAQLVISPGTVTQYTHIIYQKLMVKNRRQAVIKATELGILPSD